MAVRETQGHQNEEERARSNAFANLMREWGVNTSDEVQNTTKTEEWETICRQLLSCPITTIDRVLKAEGIQASGLNQKPKKKQLVVPVIEGCTVAGFVDILGWIVIFELNPFCFDRDQD
jgi:hypothetical protein